MNKYKYIGKPVLRTKGKEKVTGKAKFGADYVSDLVMYVYRSNISHALIKNLNIKPAMKIPGVFTIITAQDIPGDYLYGPINQDQPILADKVIRYRGEAIALIIAKDKEIAIKASNKIKLTVEKLTPVYDPLEAEKENSVNIHKKGNILDEMDIEKGDVEKAFSEADITIKKQYKTPVNDHAYIEPNAGMGEYKDGTIVIRATTQMPHSDRKNVAKMLNLSPEKIRIIQTMTGGGFGGKLESYIPLYLSLAVFKTKRKIKMVFSRKEEIQSTVKRHPAIIDIMLAANKEGKLLGIKANMILDTGAYGSYGIGVLVRALVHCTGPYRIPNAKVEGRLVYTNNPPRGAMRGFGVPQVNFAIESQMDILASKLGISPIKLRLNNCFCPGDKTITGQKLEQSVGIKETILSASKALKKEKIPEDTYSFKTGIGCSCMWYGIGKTTVPNPSRVCLELLNDGSFKIYTGAADIGQGSTTIFQQIAAEELNVSLEDVQLITADTGITPDSGVTSASRQTHITGKAIQNACIEFKKVAKKSATNSLVDYYKKIEKKIFEGYFDPVITKLDEKGQGIPYSTYGFGIQIAIIQANKKTGAISVKKVIAAHDVGQAINTLNVEGQIEGGCVMGLGHALLENVNMENGKIVNSGFADYLIPTVLDSPDINSIMIEEKESTGPFGAKGVGECSSIPTPAAIANAVYDAIRVRINTYPLLPEYIVNEIENNKSR